MKFEVLNDKGKTVFQCNQVSCIPTEEEIKSMLNARYKFKIDDKIATKKRISELIGELNDSI